MTDEPSDVDQMIKHCLSNSRSSKGITLMSHLSLIYESWEESEKVVEEIAKSFAKQLKLSGGLQLIRRSQ